MTGVYRWLVHGDGYQISSGPIIIVSAWAWALVWVKHHNCKVKGCWRLGHAHPQHGRPVCGRHARVGS